jgi:hypothetical protein
MWLQKTRDTHDAGIPTSHGEGSSTEPGLRFGGLFLSPQHGPATQGIALTCLLFEALRAGGHDPVVGHFLGPALEARPTLQRRSVTRVRHSRARHPMTGRRGSSSTRAARSGRFPTAFPVMPFPSACGLGVASPSRWVRETVLLRLLSNDSEIRQSPRSVLSLIQDARRGIDYRGVYA